MKKECYSQQVGNMFVTINLHNDSQMRATRISSNEYVIIDIDEEIVHKLEDVIEKLYGIIYEDILVKMVYIEYEPFIDVAFSKMYINK